ncbi:MAG: acetylornithine transaminase [Pseudomonadota bacterium]|jgi:acetylornithine/N-succinyldiaminopimelate aminotransferase|nr:acetylornithine transaminase [Pseudomonadota bacterium]
MNHALMTTYARQPVSFARGQGVWLWDTHGRHYLDALAGIAVCGLGHAHPAVTQAICEQASTLVHTSNLFTIDVQAQLGQQLCAIANMDAAFFCNSGAEAVEAAIKLARLHGHNKAIDEPKVIVMEGSFHGRTLAALTATGNPNLQQGFGPLMPGFIRVPYNDVDALAAVARERDDVTAVMLEPITGEGGIRVPDAGYLSAVRRLCDDQGWLLVLDEIQTGMGRTGRWFCHEHEDAMPDVMTLAKGLGNGFPIGSCLARGAAARTFKPGTHGTTFGGNPLACRAALAVLETIEREQLCERAAGSGEYLIAGLRERLDGLGGVTDIRGKGLMIGIELDRPCRELIGRALSERLVINVTADNVVRLLPPLIIERDELDTIVDVVARLTREFLVAT